MPTGCKEASERLLERVLSGRLFMSLWLRLESPREMALELTGIMRLGAWPCKLEAMVAMSGWLSLFSWTKVTQKTLWVMKLSLLWNVVKQLRTL